MPFVAVILGWPAVIASVLLTLAGIARARSSLVLAGAVVATPFLLYLAMTPRFRWVSIAVAALYFAAAVAVARRRPAVAVVLVAPFIALASAVAWLVIDQTAP